MSVASTVAGKGSVEDAAKNGVKLVYVNTAELEDADAYMMELTEGKGFDDQI